MRTIRERKVQTKPNTLKRLLAGVIDYGIYFLFFALMIYFFGVKNTQGGYSLSWLYLSITILFWAVQMIVIEQLVGATIGNYLISLRPLSLTGESRKPSFQQSLKRHLLDMIDIWFIGMLFTKNTRYNQRLGDIWAKTIVIDLKDGEQGIKWVEYEN